MNCTHCSKETDEKYIIDAVGSNYCSEECMEDYQENSNDSFDDDHPYEDDYFMLRRSYIEIIDEWKGELSKKTEDLESAVDELLDEIDELVSGYTNFIYSEGDDGPYAWEIYQYTLKLRELQKRIIAWRPDRKLLYWINCEGFRYGDSGDEAVKAYDNISRNLYLNGYEEFLLYVTKHHQHPYHGGVNYVFDNAEMAEEAFEILNPVCDKHGLEISLDEAHKCEGHCGDILYAVDDTYLDGWFYCYSCKESGKHGVFTVQELEKELRYYEENEEERQVVIHELRDWCYSYKKKIKRSCRTFEIEMVAWAD